MGAKRTVLGVATVASLLLAASQASAQDVSAANKSGGSTTLHAEIKDRLPTEIDSGWMDKGLIKVRTRFTIDPVKGGDPILVVDMPKGAAVEASWNEPGFINLKPVTGEGATGTAGIHYTLNPSLDASIYGITVSYNSSQLINMLPDASFNYDQKTTASFKPWAFAGVPIQMPQPPALDQSTLFGIGFDSLGVDTGIAEGTLKIQAATRPTFTFKTTEVRLDGASVSADGGVAKVSAIDADFMEVNAIVNGDLSFQGSLDIRPVVQVDSVDGYPTFGLVKFSFSAVSKAYSGESKTIAFAPATIRIPLPNVKVPSTPIGLGAVKAGGSASKTISIDSTGELGAVLSFKSSDPAFKVPSGQVQVPSKGKYDLKVDFSPSSDGPASATITVMSNDPDAPEQTFKVGANGAKLGNDGDDSKTGHAPGEGVPGLDDPGDSSGCSVGATHSRTTGASFAVIGLALAAVVRRRRK